MGLSVREVVAVLELIGVDRSYAAIWNWTRTLSEAQSDPPPSQVVSMIPSVSFPNRHVPKHSFDTSFPVVPSFVYTIAVS